MCFFKAITGIPCPGCGSLRSIMSLLDGDVCLALWYNPVIILLFIGGVFLFLVSLVELIIQKDKNRRKSFSETARGTLLYRLLHRSLPTWTIVIALFVTLMNWFWNIEKGL